MRDIEGDPAFVVSWNEAMKQQRLEKALESQSIDLELLASTPMHDRLTFERAQAVEEKMAERLRNGPPGKLYRDWMAEVDPQRRGEKSSSTKASSSTAPKKRPRKPSFGRYVCAYWSLYTSQPPLKMLCVAVPRNHLMPKARARLHHGDGEFLQRGTPLKREL
jgi:hypothetical protein